MNRRAMVQVLEAVVLGGALVLSGTLAASAVEMGSATPSDGSAITPREFAIAEALRHEAERLHSVPERWADAAVLHIHSADLRGLRDDVALSELFIAGGLFYETGDSEGALTTLEMAGDLSLAQRASVEARFAYEQAAAVALEVGDREAAERLARKAEHIMDNAGPSADQPLPESVLEEWRELLVETVIPAPSAAVAIGGPASDPALRLGIQLEEGLDLVSLAAPPEPGLTEIGSAGVILPAPVLSLELEAPAEAPDLTDARVKAPDLRQADMRLTAVRARDLPVSSLTVVPIPAPAAVRVAAPEVEPAQKLEELRIDAPELREPPLPALPRL